MRLVLLLAPLLAACATTASPTPQQRAERWWADVAVLSDDGMEGRLTGSPGHARAARHVVEQARVLGLEPAGSDGFLQPVALEEQVVDHARSSASLVTKAGEAKLELPGALMIGRGGGRLPGAIDAPLVFVGYGLHLPEAGHDDFAGVDLAGKIAVVVSGGPAHVSGVLKAHARRDRLRVLAERGAVGILSLTTAKAMETPWSVLAAEAGQSGMYFADASLRDVRAPFVSLSMDPAAAGKLFAGADTGFGDISAAADASRPLPRLALNARLRGRIVATQRALTSPNIVARLPGDDRRLRAEHVVFSAHLDHLGMTAAGGDRVFNGAMDNAAGVAGLLDIARSYRARGARPKRSMLFVFVTAEEKGLLGSRYFTLRPTVPKRSIVANLNFDMALPIFPLRSVIALGAGESGLGAVAAEVGRSMDLPLVDDPFPDRNSFVRSDQYSFVREGVPALAFKFGFAAGTPEAAKELHWRSALYHQAGDDLSQLVEKLDAVRLHDFVAEIGWRVANAPGRPAGNDGSFFRRFAKD